MQRLIENGYATESKDSYLLQYLLQQQGLLSTTGYKVLQGQEPAGLIPCYHVLYDTADKLDYDVEQFADLQSLLPDLAPNVFLNYAKSAMAIILNLKNIGFLHPANLETTLDKIFIDLRDNSVHLVYLPIDEALTAKLHNPYLAILKAELGKGIQEHSNLQDTMANALLPLLNDQGATLEQMIDCLAGLEPLAKPTVAAPTGTTTLGSTGVLGASSGNLTSSRLQQPASEAAVVAEEAQPEPPVEQPTKKEKKSLFGAKKTAPAEEEQDVGGTEVLTLFVPTIYLKGQGKTEFLINKQEFVLGRDSAADGTVDSTAISRRHCKITHSDERNYLTDMGSANGTYLNGAKLEPDKPRLINEGDKIKLGNVGFTVMSV